jgi:hypothetical protein
MGSLNGRVKRLEALAPEVSPSSAGVAQRRSYMVRHVLDVIQVHKWGGSVYDATDAELNTIGMLYAGNEVAGDGFPGVYEFPSGATITFPEPGKAYITGRVEVEDLPEGLRQYLVRMDPAKQPARLRQLDELHLEDDDGT